MRVPLVAGNWKMNTTVDEALALVRSMLPQLGSIVGVEAVLCPPFVSLAPIAQLLGAGAGAAPGSGPGLGAQDVFWEDRGAYTGEISSTMLSPICQYVIVGHSERRQYFGETNEIVNRKAQAALRHGLRPIVCVGENLEQNEAGQTERIVTTQVRESLAGIADASSLAIAYEPVWAIGTGRPATGPGANDVVALIRRILADMFGVEAAQEIRIQYGGSVTASNASEFLLQPEIDGALVGGASLRADEFTTIVQKAAQAKNAV